MRALSLRFFFALALTAPALADEPVDETSVLEVARSYADGGGYNREWKGSGSPDEIRHAGQLILAEAEGGTFCCGYTLAVAVRVARARGLLEGKSADQLRRFQKLWYGSTDEDREVLCAFASEDLGIGHKVPLDEALPGDFVQLWRANGTGHSTVLLEWVRENDQVVGFRYRSSQGSTSGVADKVEYFAGVAGRERGVVRERTHACRLFEQPGEDE